MLSFPSKTINMHAESCPTLCDTTDCYPPGSSVHGVFQANAGVGCRFLLQGRFMLSFPLEGTPKACFIFPHKFPSWGLPHSVFVWLIYWTWLQGHMFTFLYLSVVFSYNRNNFWTLSITIILGLAKKFVYVWTVPSLFTWNCHIVNWLYIPIKNLEFKKIFVWVFL